MKLYVILLVVVLVALACVWEVSGSGAAGDVSCSSCGRECQAACGTRHFRACCFNFQRRRRASTDTGPRLADRLGSGDPDSSDPASSLADPGRAPALAAYFLQDAAQEEDQDGTEGAVDPLQEAGRGTLPLRGVAQFLGRSSSPRMGALPPALSFPQLLRIIKQY